MDKKSQKIKSIVKGTAPESKFGTDPNDPWSAKSGITESGGTHGALGVYLKSRGINPKYVTKDQKIAHTKSGQFARWMQAHMSRSHPIVTTTESNHLGDLKNISGSENVTNRRENQLKKRMSKQAPVPVVAVTKKENRLGGAANVALNISSMGATPILCSVVGEDENANALSKLMKKSKMREDGILRSKSRTTTVKTRVIGGQHQMSRIDEEMDQDLNTQDTRAFLSKIKALLKKERVSAIIFEDYDKGVLNAELISAVVATSKKNNIPIRNNRPNS